HAATRLPFAPALAGTKGHVDLPVRRVEPVVPRERVAIGLGHYPNSLAGLCALSANLKLPPSTFAATGSKSPFHSHRKSVIGVLPICFAYSDWSRKTNVPGVITRVCDGSPHAHSPFHIGTVA